MKFSAFLVIVFLASPLPLASFGIPPSFLLPVVLGASAPQGTAESRTAATKAPSAVLATLAELPLLPVADGFWQRAGELRAKGLRKRRTARLGDALIAETCVDSGIPLITRDHDFRAFADAADLDVVVGADA